eukprot:5517662-Amphidinium_carterae.2
MRAVSGHVVAPQLDKDTGGPMRESSVMRDLDADTNKLFERLPAMFKRMLELQVSLHKPLIRSKQRRKRAQQEHK